MLKKCLKKVLKAAGITPALRHRDTRSGVIPAAFISLSLLLTFVTSCDKSKPPLEIIPNMDDQKRINPQAEAPRMPIEGTVARGTKIYPYKGKPEVAEEKLKNPLKPTADNIYRGQFIFNAYCLLCHGSDGTGMGPVAKKGFVPPPSLHTKRALNWKDGRYFHIITEGQGIMSPYAAQIDPLDRWAAINYIRTLQKMYKKEKK